MVAVIRAITSHLPAGQLTNEELAAGHPDWSVEKIAEKTGIDTRHRVADDEFTLDLAEAAARKLLDAQGAEGIDAVLLCTQSPDWLIPSGACILQSRLGLPQAVIAYDFNLGCSGYVMGLAQAKGLLAGGLAKRILFVTADTYTRYIDPDDRSVRTLFGDAATASIIEAAPDEAPGSGGIIGDFVFGTDGSGAPNLLLVGAGFNGKAMDERPPQNPPKPTLYMDGPEIFAFTLKTVPKTVKALYAKAGIEADDIDRFVFHQANRYMLEHLRRKLRIPEERFVIEIADLGNTVSSTIPLALERSLADGRVTRGHKLALVGFGVGLSWAACTIDWR